MLVLEGQEAVEGDGRSVVCRAPLLLLPPVLAGALRGHGVRAACGGLAA
ncbi:hypothetical protein ACFQY7_37670 [Actinomadura luteofluorescens]